MVDQYLGKDDPGNDPQEFVTFAYPNPFSQQTRLQFDLGFDNHVRIEIYDTRGIYIRHLLEKDLQAGIHTISWDGKDGAGREAASGIYVCKITIGDKTYLKKLIRGRQ